MSIWFDSTLISQYGNQDYLSDVLNSGLNGDIDEAVYIAINNAPNNQELNRVIELLSCIWHEQKHFFDFSFTTYGAFRFRQFFEIYINLTPTLYSIINEDTELVFPIDAALDPVRKKILNIKSSEVINTIANAIKKRKNISKGDRDTIEIDGLKYEFGGEAQLEALAYITQITAIQTYFGSQTSLSVQDLTPEHIRSNQKYNWFIKIGQHFKILSPKKISEGQFLLNIAPLLPILYASLSNRYWGKEENDENYKSDIPSFRFAYIIEQILTVKEEYLKKDLFNQWMQVNEICKKKWGKTVLEELNRDIEKEEQHLQLILNQPHISDTLKEAFQDYHDLRKKLHGIFRDDPLQIIDPELFVKNILPLVRPMPIAAYPHGLEVSNEGWGRVLGFEEGEKKWDWALIPNNWHSQNTFLSLKKTSDWGSIISDYSPIAKLLINGRKHKTMLGPELIVAEQILRKHGYKLKFDPLFEFPVEKNGISFFYYLTNKKEVVCDICESKIKYPEGHLLSPWFFRYSNRNAMIAITVYGDGEDGKYRFYKDWSYWLVCDNCIEDIRQNFDWQE